MYNGLYLFRIGNHGEALEYHIAAVQHLLSRLVYNEYIDVVFDEGSTIADVLLCMACCRCILNDLYALYDNDPGRRTDACQMVNGYVYELSKLLDKACGDDSFHQVDNLRVLGLRDPSIS